MKTLEKIQLPDIESKWEMFLSEYETLTSDEYACLKGAFFCGAAACLDILLDEEVIIQRGTALVSSLISELEYANPDRMN